MSAWGMTANPVYGKAEDQVPVAVFTTHDLAVEYVEASRIEGHPNEGGYFRSFGRDSLLYDFNGSSVGDWYPPEGGGGGYWVINPCIFDVQLVELTELPTAGFLPIDPAPPSRVEKCRSPRWVIG